MACLNSLLWRHSFCLSYTPFHVREGTSHLCALEAVVLGGNGRRFALRSSWLRGWLNRHATRAMKISCASAGITFGENSEHTRTRIARERFQTWPGKVPEGSFQVLFFVARIALSLRCERRSRIDRKELSWFYRACINYKSNFSRIDMFHNTIDAIKCKLEYIVVHKYIKSTIKLETLRWNNLKINKEIYWIWLVAILHLDQRDLNRSQNDLGIHNYTRKLALLTELNRTFPSCWRYLVDDEWFIPPNPRC